jgi:hypothetical protein
MSIPKGLIETGAAATAAAALLAGCNTPEEAPASPTPSATQSSETPGVAHHTQTETAKPTSQPEKTSPSPTELPQLLTKKLGFITLTDKPMTAKEKSYHAEQRALVEQGVQAFEEGLHGTVDLQVKDYDSMVISIDPTKRQDLFNPNAPSDLKTTDRIDAINEALSKYDKKSHPDAWIVSMQVTDYLNGPSDNEIDRGVTWEHNGQTYSALFEHPVTDDGNADPSVVSHELGHLINRTLKGVENKYAVDEASGLECTDILVHPGNGFPLKLTQKSINSCVSVPREDLTTGMSRGTMVDTVDQYGGPNEVQTGVIGDHVSYIDTSIPHTESIKLHTLADTQTDGKKVIGMLLPKNLSFPFFDSKQPGRACLFIEESSELKKSNNPIVSEFAPDRNHSSLKFKLVHCDVAQDNDGKIQLKPFGQTFLLRTAEGADPGVSPSLRGEVLRIGNISIAQTGSAHAPNASWSQVSINVS